MGPQQLGLAMLFSRYSQDPHYQSALGAFRANNLEFVLAHGELGLAQPSTDSSLVADSACSGTALASGVETAPGTIGLDSQGSPVKTILEMARDAGKATGLVSDTRMTHATPAVFAAHIIDRNMENDIAAQMLESRVTVLLSGGLRHFLPAAVTVSQSPLRKHYAAVLKNTALLQSKRRDDRDLIAEAHDRGYDVIFDRQSLQSSNSDNILGLFAPSGMPDGIHETLSLQDTNRQIPTLAEMTSHALRTLEKNPNGFFLMVEAGQIDWAGHANDVGMLLHEMLRLDRALGPILRWAAGRQDTLILVTADHETGSFGFSYSGYHIPAAQTFTDTHTGATLRYQPQYNFISPSILQKIFEQRMTLYELLNYHTTHATPDTSFSLLKTLIKNNLGFSISTRQARDILRTKENRYYVPDHEKLSARYFPYIHDFAATYPDPDMARTAIIARALADQTGVVWGTGSHTSTPVTVSALGPETIARQFNGYLQQTRIGQLLQAALLGTSAAR